jgi:hypothetical protein
MWFLFLCPIVADDSRYIADFGHKLVRVLYTDIVNSSNNKAQGIFRSFFPQMKPEQQQVAITDEEKAVFAILKSNSPILLNDLKVQSGLSNKNRTRPSKA